MDSSSPSLYATLGIEFSASDEEVKRAYRKLAIQNHPDKHNNDQGKAKLMKEINHAYNVLSNPEERKKYDQKRRPPVFSPNDLFSSFFQHRSERFPRQPQPPPQPQPPSAVTVNIYLPVHEIITGVQKNLELEMDDQCSRCGGCGASDRSRIKTCAHCMGCGHVSMMIPPIHIQQPCHVCKQTGKVVSDADKCGACKGTGLVNRKRFYVLQIPAGTESGTHVVLPGKGPCSDPKLQAYADLQVVIHHHVEAPFFVVPGRPASWLGCDVHITLRELLLGFTRTLNGNNIQIRSKEYFNPVTHVCIIPGRGLSKSGSLQIRFHVDFEEELDLVNDEQENDDENDDDDQNEENIYLCVSQYLHDTRVAPAPQ